MSDLTDYANTHIEPCDSRDPYVQGQHEMFELAIGNIKRLLPAHDAEIREQAMREQMEADCAAACDYCRNGLYFDGESHIERIRVFDGTPEGHEEQEEINCKALAIRTAYAKAHPESGIKEANVAIVPYATVDGQPCDGNGRMLPEAAK